MVVCNESTSGKFWNVKSLDADVASFQKANLSRCHHGSQTARPGSAGRRYFYSCMVTHCPRGGWQPGPYRSLWETWSWNSPASTLVLKKKIVQSTEWGRLQLCSCHRVPGGSGDGSACTDPLFKRTESATCVLQTASGKEGSGRVRVYKDVKQSRNRKGRKERQRKKKWRYDLPANILSP